MLLVMGPYSDWVSDQFPIACLCKHNNPTSISMGTPNTHKTPVRRIVPETCNSILAVLVNDLFCL